MNCCYAVGITYFLITFALRNINGFPEDKDNPYRHVEALDKDGRYQLEWHVDWETSRVIFNVKVQTKGYVGLGLSRKGKMSGADIVIGGVLPSGEPYFSDRHAIGNQLPVEDLSQDWKLHEAWETETHTCLRFSRSFETCDEDHDLSIHGDVIGVIWAFGENDDEIEYHHQNRGVFYAYLLRPDLTPRDLQNMDREVVGNHVGNWKVWKIPGQQLVPAKDTTYLCSIHQLPENKDQHVVGFRTILPTESETRHVHHFLFHRCVAPEGENPHELFGTHLGRKEECYVLPQPAGRIPTNYCTELVHVWAVGGKPFFFPDHVGLPLYANEYFMLQVHYNNPEMIPNVQVDHTLEIFYTEKMRKFDVGLLGVGHHEPSPVSLLIPPNSLNHEIYGHCSRGCLENMLPPTGINVFAAMMHTHLTGQTARILHFRDNQEMPWVSYDNNWNFNFQQVEVLREERRVISGDSLFITCQFRNTDRQGNVTIGGFSSSHEMCSSILWYYPKIPGRGLCRSELRTPDYRNFLQIHNTTWSNEHIEEVVTRPLSNAGLLISQVGNLRMDWTLENRRRLQEFHRYAPQVTDCPSVFSGQPQYAFVSVLPKPALRYERLSTCDVFKK